MSRLRENKADGLKTRNNSCMSKEKRKRYINKIWQEQRILNTMCYGKNKIL